MEQILQQILEKNSTVILPHLGAIIKLGESYQFNEFLKYNDGKLISAVEESKKISKDEATEVVSDFIRSIKEAINANQEFDLGKLGFLINKKGRITLTSSKTTSTTEVEKKVVVPTVAPKKEEPKTELPKVDAEISKETLKKTAPTLPNKAVQKIETPLKKTEEPKEEIKTSLAKAYTSSNLVSERAIEKIESFTTPSELKSFGEGEKREAVLDAIQIKIKELTKSKLEKPASILVTPIEKVETKKVEIKEVPKKVEEKTKKIAKPIAPISKIEDLDKKEIKTTKEKAVVATPLVKAEKAKEEEKDNLIKAKLASGAIVIEKEAKKRKRNRFILWTAIILLLLGSSIVGYLQKDKILNLFSHNQIAENSHNDSKSIANTKHEDKTPVHSDNNEHTTKEDTHGESADKNADHDEVIDEENESAAHEEEVSDQSTSEEADENSADNNNVAIEEEVEEEEVVEEIVEEEIVETAPGGKYNIVVGSFSDKGNAEKLVDKLKGEGYSNAKTLPKTGSLTAVSIANFDSRSDAKSTLKEIKGKGYSGWIKKIK